MPSRNLFVSSLRFQWLGVRFSRRWLYQVSKAPTPPKWHFRRILCCPFCDVLSISCLQVVTRYQPTVSWMYLFMACIEVLNIFRSRKNSYLNVLIRKVKGIHFRTYRSAQVLGIVLVCCIFNSIGCHGRKWCLPGPERAYRRAQAGS